MNVAILPLDIIEAKPKKNLKNVENLVMHLHHDTDILVLPELFSTGFVHDEATFQLLAETNEGDTISTLRDISSKYNIAIVGSFLCRSEQGTLKNRAFFIDPDLKNISFYDKRHLFIISPEYKLLESGDRPSPIIKYRGWNIALSICFDIRFPVWCRNTGNIYDLMIVPANWPDSRFTAWKTLLKARAIENLACIVGCNRTGIDQFGTYSYLSSFGVDYKGNIISEIHGNTPIRYAQYDLDALRLFRVKFPVFNSADTFNINFANAF